MPGVETPATGSLCVQCLCVLPFEQVLCARGAAAGQYDWSMLAETPARSEQPSGEHARQLLSSLRQAASRCTATCAVAGGCRHPQRQQRGSVDLEREGKLVKGGHYNRPLRTSAILLSRDSSVVCGSPHAGSCTRAVREVL